MLTPRHLLTSLLLASASCGGSGDGPSDGAVDGSDADVDAAPFSCATAMLGCGAGTVTISDGATCFHACSEPVTHENAEERCVAWGGHVAAIHSTAEQATVVGLGAAPIWIGHIQKLPGGIVQPATGWRWLDLSAVDFEPWATMQPDDGNGTENGAEDCAAIATATTWADEPCTNKHPFVCRH